MTMHLTRAWLCWAVLLSASAVSADEWFAPFERVADYRPKGPTHCFRQFNIDWSWISPRPDQLPEFLSEADPVALAEFCRRTHIDGTVVMAVPHHGYCTYDTRAGTRFPGMKGDWFGRTIEELHKRRIAAFGYVTLNWNWKFLRENWGRDFVHGRFEAEGVLGHSGMICLNAPGYLDLVEAYTREVLEHYPVDGMRWDILMTAEGCKCEGCKKFYRQRYGEELTGWDRGDPNRARDFYLATTERAVMRLHALCKRIKPSVEIWQNCIQSYHPNHLDLARQMDIAYNEYGDPFRLLFIRGVADKLAAINGLMNKTPTEPPLPLDRCQWRTCLALGGRCYSYYGHKQTNPKTLLPNETMLVWHREQLAPFYEMVGRIEPWLHDAVPVSHVGIVFSERTRFRYPKYDRQPYIAAMEAITNAFLQRNVPIEFVNALDLADPAKRIARFKLLVLPLTSGLLPEEVACLRTYVEQGGTLLLAGDALRHDDRGRPLEDFALAREMGVSYRGAITAASDLPIDGKLPFGGSLKLARIKNVVRVWPVAGQTLLGVAGKDFASPLLHVNAFGRGKVAYLASLDSLQLTGQVIDWLGGPPSVRVEGPVGNQVVLTQQPQQKRWILHLISAGAYTIDLSSADVPAAKIVDHYPADGWTCRLERTKDGLQIRVEGRAQDRLLVLQ
jgi:hypothetical protein